MSTRNDITGDAIKSKVPNDAYRNSPFWDSFNKPTTDDDEVNKPTPEQLEEYDALMIQLKDAELLRSTPMSKPNKENNE